MVPNMSGVACIFCDMNGRNGREFVFAKMSFVAFYENFQLDYLSKMLLFKYFRVEMRADILITGI